MFWATVEDRYIAVGQTHGDVTAECMTAGTAGNGYLAGQIATIVDVFDYYTRVRTTIPLPGRKAATLPRLKP